MGVDSLRCEGKDDPDDHRMDPGGDAKGNQQAGNEPQPKQPHPWPRPLKSGKGHGDGGLLSMIEGTPDAHEPAHP